MSIGKSVSNTINPGNSVALYQVIGNPGQILSFNLQNATQWTGANWVLYDPTGHAIETPSANSPNFTVGLPQAGNYTLAVIGNSTNPVSYSFQVTDKSTDLVANTGFGVTQTVTPGQQENYTFTANAGIAVLFDSLTNFGVNVSLLNPDGSYVSRGFGGNTD